MTSSKQGSQLSLKGGIAHHWAEITSFPLKRTEVALRLGLSTVPVIILSTIGEPASLYDTTYIGIIYLILIGNANLRTAMFPILLSCIPAVILSMCCLSFVLLCGVTVSNESALGTMYLAFIFCILLISCLRIGNFKQLTFLPALATVYLFTSAINNVVTIGQNGISLFIPIADVKSAISTTPAADVMAALAVLEAKTGIDIDQLLISLKPQIINVLTTGKPSNLAILVPDGALAGQNIVIAIQLSGINVLVEKGYWIIRLLWIPSTTTYSPFVTLLLTVLLVIGFFFLCVIIPPVRRCNVNVVEACITCLEKSALNLSNIRIALNGDEKTTISSASSASKNEKSPSNHAIRIILTGQDTINECELYGMRRDLMMCEHRSKNDLSLAQSMTRYCAMMTFEWSLWNPGPGSVFFKELNCVSTCTVDLCEDIYGLCRVIRALADLMTSEENDPLLRQSRGLLHVSAAILKDLIEILRIPSRTWLISDTKQRFDTFETSLISNRLLLNDLQSEMYQLSVKMMTHLAQKPLTAHDAERIDLLTYMHSYVIQTCCLRVVAVTESVIAFKTAASTSSLKGLLTNVGLVCLPSLLVFVCLFKGLFAIIFPYPHLKRKSWRSRDFQYAMKWGIGIILACSPSFWNTTWRQYQFGFSSDTAFQRIILDSGYSASQIGGWEALACMVTLYMTIEGTMQRVALRLIGSFLGILAGYLGGIATNGNIAGAVAWIAIYTMCVVWISADPVDPTFGFHPRWGYASRVSIWTCGIVILGSYGPGVESVGEVAVARAVGMCVGVAFSIAVSHFIWPCVAGLHARHAVCVAIKESYLCLRTTIYNFTSIPSLEKNCIPRNIFMDVNTKSYIEMIPEVDLSLANLHFDTALEYRKLAEEYFVDGTIWPLIQPYKIGDDGLRLYAHVLRCLNYCQQVRTILSSEGSLFGITATDEELFLHGRHPCTMMLQRRIAGIDLDHVGNLHADYLKQLHLVIDVVAQYCTLAIAAIDRVGIADNLPSQIAERVDVDFNIQKNVMPVDTLLTISCKTNRDAGINHLFRLQELSLEIYRTRAVAIVSNDSDPKLFHLLSRLKWQGVIRNVLQLMAEFVTITSSASLGFESEHVKSS